MIYKAWRVESNDNVAVVIQNVVKGSMIEVEGKKIQANEDIPQGHKIAILDIPKGQMVKKYGFPIGEANKDIKIGDYVHTHNTEDITEQLCDQYFEAYVAKGVK